jgi:hypothetical protein
VLILSEDFISKKYPMEELQLLLARNRQGVKLMPVFYDVLWENLSAKADRYKIEAGEAGTEDPALKLQWYHDLQELKRITGFRPDQVRCFHPLHVFIIFTLTWVARQQIMCGSKAMDSPSLMTHWCLLPEYCVDHMAHKRACIGQTRDAALYASL